MSAITILRNNTIAFLHTICGLATISECLNFLHMKHYVRVCQNLEDCLLLFKGMLYLTNICSYSVSTHNSGESYSNNTLSREAAVTNTVKTIYALQVLYVCDLL